MTGGRRESRAVGANACAQLVSLTEAHRAWRESHGMLFERASCVINLLFEARALTIGGRDL
jgi:hypothetical protein